MDSDGTFDQNIWKPFDIELWFYYQDACNNDWYNRCDIEIEDKALNRVKDPVEVCAVAGNFNRKLIIHLTYHSNEYAYENIGNDGAFHGYKLGNISVGEMYHILGIILEMALISLDIGGFKSLWHPPTHTTLSFTCWFDINDFLCLTQDHIYDWTQWIACKLHVWRIYDMNESPIKNHYIILSWKWQCNDFVTMQQIGFLWKSQNSVTLDDIFDFDIFESCDKGLSYAFWHVNADLAYSIFIFEFTNFNKKDSQHNHLPLLKVELQNNHHCLSNGNRLSLPLWQQLLLWPAKMAVAALLMETPQPWQHQQTSQLCCQG